MLHWKTTEDDQGDKALPPIGADDISVDGSQVLDWIFHIK